MVAAREQQMFKKAKPLFVRQFVTLRAWNSHLAVVSRAFAQKSKVSKGERITINGLQRPSV